MDEDTGKEIESAPALPGKATAPASFPRFLIRESRRSSQKKPPGLHPARLRGRPLHRWLGPLRTFLGPAVQGAVWRCALAQATRPHAALHAMQDTLFSAPAFGVLLAE